MGRIEIALYEIPALARAPRKVLHKFGSRNPKEQSRSDEVVVVSEYEGRYASYSQEGGDKDIET